MEKGSIKVNLHYVNIGSERRHKIENEASPCEVLLPIAFGLSFSCIHANALVNFSLFLVRHEWKTRGSVLNFFYTSVGIYTVCDRCNMSGLTVYDLRGWLKMSHSKYPTVRMRILYLP